MDTPWYPAEQVMQMLGRYVIDHAFPSRPVNRWIGAMFVPYRPHIEALPQSATRSCGPGRKRIPAGTCSRIARWTSPAGSTFQWNIFRVESSGRSPPDKADHGRIRRISNILSVHQHSELNT
jgi:hypothetical protein